MFLFFFNTEKSRYSSQSKKFLLKVSKARILSGVLRPLLRRTDQTLTALEQLVLPQTAWRTRIRARKHRPWNTTQETHPDAPIKTRWIHKYSGFTERLHRACASLVLPGWLRAATLGCVKHASFCYLKLNFSFNVRFDIYLHIICHIKIWDWTVESKVIRASQD